MGFVVVYGFVEYTYQENSSGKSDGFNLFANRFCVPFLTIDAILRVNPSDFNLRIISEDFISKVFIILLLAVWAISTGRYEWSITSFSLSSFIIGVVVACPLVRTLYGEEFDKLVVQGIVFQTMIWFNFSKPAIIQHSLSMMRTAGCTAFFSMGMFMAYQDNLIACETRYAIMGTILIFCVGPTIMGISCFLVGLRRDPLRIAIMEATLP
ncbi:auxin efflux carrier component 5-like [Rutidosis leptorrhynchoides]|uniref:auxin efflux carrier component 5-like n=1 Tax=Rutidosis leptorrhynchoides TaxID=125765 RepID=UPI003A99118C